MNPTSTTSPAGLAAQSPAASSPRTLEFDSHALLAETPDLGKIGLALGSLAQLAYENDEAEVKRTLASAGLRLVTGFLNPFARKGAQGLAVESEDFLILAFRGTDEPVDWIRNLRMVPSRWWGIYPRPVHKGFAAALSMIWKPAVASVLQRALEKPVVFAGHSLGGALAMLAASRFPAEAVKWIHTFGQPLTGTPPFCEHFAIRFPGKYVRWVNHDDVVARIPPQPLFGHTGRLMQFDGAGNLVEAGAEGGPERRLRPMNQAEFEAFRELIRRHRAWRGEGGGGTPPPGVADHSLANGYLPKLRRLVAG